MFCILCKGKFATRKRGGSVRSPRSLERGPPLSFNPLGAPNSFRPTSVSNVAAGFFGKTNPFFKRKKKTRTTFVFFFKFCLKNGLKSFVNERVKFSRVKFCRDDGYVGQGRTNSNFREQNKKKQNIKMPNGMIK